LPDSESTCKLAKLVLPLAMCCEANRPSRHSTSSPGGFTRHGSESSGSVSAACTTTASRKSTRRDSEFITCMHPHGDFATRLAHVTGAGEKQPFNCSGHSGPGRDRSLHLGRGQTIRSVSYHIYDVQQQQQPNQVLYRSHAASVQGPRHAPFSRGLATQMHGLTSRA